MLIVDASRALKKVEKLQKELSEQTIGAALQDIATQIAQNMALRLLEDEDGNARTTWRDDTSYSLFRNSRKHYMPGARQEIAKALTVTPVSTKVIDGKKALWIGIGDLDELDAVGLSQPTPSHRYKLWKILEYGTGLFTTYPASPKMMIVRTGLQRFPIRRSLRGGFSVKSSMIGKPVGELEDGSHNVSSPSRTRNPGQAGRHFLFAISGEIYQADRALLHRISEVIADAVSGVR